MLRVTRETVTHPTCGPRRLGDGVRLVLCHDPWAALIPRLPLSSESSRIAQDVGQSNPSLLRTPPHPSPHSADIDRVPAIGPAVG